MATLFLYVLFKVDPFFLGFARMPTSSVMIGYRDDNSCMAYNVRDPQPIPD